MLEKITETTSGEGLSNPGSKKLFRLESGEFSQRMLAIVRTSPYQLTYSWADAPYVNWSEPVLFADDVGDFPFDAVMDPEGNVWVAYSEQGTYYIVTRKLTFASGTWTGGNKVYVYNSGVSLIPSIDIDTSGKLWLSWSHLDLGTYDIRVKSSDDGGAVWGTGPADAGESIASGLTSAQSKLLAASGWVRVIYTGTGDDIRIRSMSQTGGSWSDEFTIASASGINDRFDAVVSQSGLVGVAFDSGQVSYREFDGSNWNSVVTLDENGGVFPQLRFIGDIPVVTYLSDLAAGGQVAKFTHRRSGTFSTPEILDNGAAGFDSVILYDSASATYADLTSAALSDSSGDIFHPSSSVMLKNAGDAVYLGMHQRFRFARMILSPAGIGGSVVFSYYNGSNWRSFVPSGGGFDLDAADKALVLWDDLGDVPGDWQKWPVDGVSRYWVKIEVVVGFTTGPIGSQITAAGNLTALACRR